MKCTWTELPSCQMHWISSVRSDRHKTGAAKQAAAYCQRIPAIKIIEEECCFRLFPLLPQECKSMSRLKSLRVHYQRADLFWHLQQDHSQYLYENTKLLFPNLRICSVHGLGILEWQSTLYVKSVSPFFYKAVSVKCGSEGYSLLANPCPFSGNFEQKDLDKPLLNKRIELSNSLRKDDVM